MLEAVQLLQKKLRRKKLDALLVSQSENRRYLSGYSVDDISLDESSGLLLIPAHGRSILLTDFRYREQAEAEAADFEVYLYPRGLLHLLKKLLPSLHIYRLAFESHAMQHAKAIAIEKLLASLGGEAIATSGLVEKQRFVKSSGELEKIRQSVQLNEQVFQKVYGAIRSGQTEKEVAHKIEQTMVEMGADKPAFETIVGSGPNGALPHAVPSGRMLQEGEPIVIDMGLRLNGYCSDMTRTVVLGKPADLTLERIRLVRKAQCAALQIIRPGMTCREVDQAARKIISQAGFGANFGHALGHGVGLAVHEPPSLSSRSRKQLHEGMVITVEPGIYFPGWGGIRLENMVRITKGGCEVLNVDTTFLDV